MLQDLKQISFAMNGHEWRMNLGYRFCQFSALCGASLLLRGLLLRRKASSLYCKHGLRQKLIHHMVHISNSLACGPHSRASTVNATVGGWHLVALLVLLLRLNAKQGNSMYNSLSLWYDPIGATGTTACYAAIQSLGIPPLKSQRSDLYKRVSKWRH